MLDHGLIKVTQNTIDSIKQDLIPNLIGLCDYVDECLEYYRMYEAEEDESVNQRKAIYDPEEVFMRKTSEALAELAENLGLDYQEGFDALNQISIRTTGVSLDD